MSFNIAPSRSGKGVKTKLSIAAAPYVVNLKNGKSRFYSALRDIYGSLSIDAVVSVFDRHRKNYLDLETLWRSHRRKIVTIS